MNIDLHTHVKLSKKLPFFPEDFAEMIREAKENGLDALAVTEHFNTSRFADIYAYLDARYPYVDDYYDVDGLKLFPGLEVDIAETGHILLLAGRESILAIWCMLREHQEPGRFIRFENLLRLAEEFGAIKIGAHPFRDSTPLAHLERELLGRLDALDLNGKDLYKQGVEACRGKVEKLAAELGLPVTAGSDTHHYLQYGSVWNELERECRTIGELKRMLAERRYAVKISPCLDSKVKAATLAKKLLKKQRMDEMAAGKPEEFAG